MQPPPTRAPGMEAILLVVGTAFGVSRIHLDSTRRDAPTVEARHVAWWLARAMTGLSYPQIADATGGRDHTSVMHGVLAIQWRIARDPTFAARLGVLQGILGDLAPLDDPRPAPPAQPARKAAAKAARR